MYSKIHTVHKMKGADKFVKTFLENLISDILDFHQKNTTFDFILFYPGEGVL